MCGVPIERADEYLQRLIALGFRVAVCEQLEDPAEARKRGDKSVVRRDVTRLVTPGTITEERLLEPGRANLLVAVQRLKQGEGRAAIGLAALDISTGAFSLVETDEAGLGDRNCAPRAQRDRRAGNSFRRRQFFRGSSRKRAPPPRRWRDRATSPKRSSASPNSLASRRSTASASSLARKSLRRRWRSPMSSARRSTRRRGSRRPTRRARGKILEIDAATRANLELTRTLSGERAGSVLATIDLTQDPRRRAADRRAAREPVHRHRRDRRAPRRRRILRRGAGVARRAARDPCLCARFLACAGAARARTAAARAILRRCATGCSRAPRRGKTRGPRERPPRWLTLMRA